MPPLGTTKCSSDSSSELLDILPVGSHVFCIDGVPTLVEIYFDTETEEWIYRNAATGAIVDVAELVPCDSSSAVAPRCYQWDNGGTIEQVTAYVATDEMGAFAYWEVTEGNAPPDLTLPDALTPCNDRNDPPLLLCDIIEGDGGIPAQTLGMYPGVNGLEDYTVNGTDLDITVAGNEFALSGQNGTLSDGVRFEGAGGVATLTLSAAAGEVTINVVSFSPLEFLTFDIAPIAFTNATDNGGNNFNGDQFDDPTTFTFPAGTTSITMDSVGTTGAAVFTIEDVSVTGAASAGEVTKIPFRRDYRTTPPTDTDLDDNPYLVIGDVGLCGDDECGSSKADVLCDIFPEQEEIPAQTLGMYPGADGNENYVINGVGIDVTVDAVGPAASGTIGPLNGLLFSGGIGGIGSADLIFSANAGDITLTLENFSNLELLTFNVPPIAFTGATDQVGNLFTGNNVDGIATFTFPAGTQLLNLDSAGTVGINPQYILTTVAVAGVAESTEKVFVPFRRDFSTTPPTDTDLDKNPYEVQGEVGLCCCDDGGGSDITITYETLSTVCQQDQANPDDKWTVSTVGKFENGNQTEVLTYYINRQDSTISEDPPAGIVLEPCPEGNPSITSRTECRTVTVDGVGYSVNDQISHIRFFDSGAQISELFINQTTGLTLPDNAVFAASIPCVATGDAERDGVTPRCYWWDNNGVVEKVVAYAELEVGSFVQWVVLDGTPPADLTLPNALIPCQPPITWVEKLRELGVPAGFQITGALVERDFNGVQVQTTGNIADNERLLWKHNGRLFVVRDTNEVISYDPLDLTIPAVVEGNITGGMPAARSWSAGDPTSEFVYVGRFGGRGRINKDTLVYEGVAGINGESGSGGFHTYVITEEGEHYYIYGDDINLVDDATGAATPLGLLPFTIDTSAYADGAFYGIQVGNNRIHRWTLPDGTDTQQVGNGFTNNSKLVMLNTTALDSDRPCFTRLFIRDEIGKTTAEDFDSGGNQIIVEGGHEPCEEPVPNLIEEPQTVNVDTTISAGFISGSIAIIGAGTVDINGQTFSAGEVKNYEPQPNDGLYPEVTLDNFTGGAEARIFTYRV